MKEWMIEAFSQSSSTVLFVKLLVTDNLQIPSDFRKNKWWFLGHVLIGPLVWQDGASLWSN